MNQADDFWSIAFLSNNEAHCKDHGAGDEHDNEFTSFKTFTIFPPETVDPSSMIDDPLTIRVQLNNAEGVLDDVSGIPWDASLLLASYLYGTSEGRCLCFNACSSSGGILELGSGLGIVGLAATATCFKCTAEKAVSSRVVLTDRNDGDILKYLKRNVDTNIAKFRTRECNASPQNPYNIYVEACDWMEVSANLQTVSTSSTQKDDCQLPRRPFNLILGSALVHIPDHAAACADAIYYYLSDNCSNQEAVTERQAIIVQLPDRSGFGTHFLPRCFELGLKVVCKELDVDLVERVERAFKIASGRDYRMYILTK